jgi:N-acetylated-alpha-linked acidic dipeptidase
MTESAKKVDYPYSDKTLYDQWRGDREEPAIGNLGGGSDHIGFYMHVGVPSLSGGAGGPTLYHTNYDSFHFYETYADPEFKMGGTVEKWAGLMALRMANADVIPYAVSRYAADLKEHVANAVKKVKNISGDFDGFKKVDSALVELEMNSAKLDEVLNEFLALENTAERKIKEINKQLIGLEKSFIDQKGMYYGSWYKSLYASTDPFSGYASWILPGIEYEVSLASVERLSEWDERYAAAITNLSDKIRNLSQYIDN